MKEYITSHNTQASYDVSKKRFAVPHVALVKDDFKVHYMRENPYFQYLTFVALEDGTFKFSGNSINYSLDNGKTWVVLPSDTNTPTVTSGSKIMWKASGLTPTYSSGIGKFSSSGRFDVEGNIMSLVYGDDFKGQEVLSQRYAFKALFSGCGTIINAKKLLLTATVLNGQNEYEGMFSNCTSLTTAPELPATTLVSNCYSNMFNSCYTLNYIKAMFLTTPSYEYTSWWVDGVSSEGTFVVNANAEWDTQACSSESIPCGWTVETYTPS